MNKLIKEISAIVSQYGVDIVIEERFVNILKDLYPDRDHPEKFEILRTIVSEGVSSEMIATVNANNAKSIVEKHAKVLSAKSGYNQQDISQVLYCLCIGCDCISIDDYKAIVKPNRPKTSPTKPQPANPQPAKQKYKNVPKIACIVLGYLGFFVTPLIMLLHHSGSSLFLILLLTMLVHGLTVLPCAIGLYKSRPNYLYGGLFCGLMLCLAIYMFIGPFNEESELMHFWGIKSDYNSPFELTMMLSVILSLFYLAGSSFGCEIAGKDTSDFWGMIVGGGFEGFKPFGASLSNYRFVIGVLISVLVCVSLYIIIHTAPITFHIFNNSVIELTENRKQKNMDLSFMDFKLGSNIDSCHNIISKSDKYRYSNEDEFFDRIRFSKSDEWSYNSLRVKGLYYSNYIDSVIECCSTLDNFPILIKLYTHKKKVFAIEYLTHQDIGVLLESYRSKYGRYEIFSNMAQEFFNKKRVDYFDYNNRYYWIYNNCLIELSSNSWHSATDCRDIIYLSREFDSLLEKEAHDRLIEEELKEKKQKMIEEQKKQEARKRAEEELKEKEEAHQKAIDEI